MNSGYYPNVINNKPRIQTASIQKPFYFGGSQVPNNLNMSKGSGIITKKLVKSYKK